MGQGVLAVALAGVLIVSLVPAWNAEGGAPSVPLRVSRGGAVVELAGTDAVSADGVYVVQFAGPVEAAWRAALEARAEAVYDYLPEFAFLVRLAPDQRDAVAAMQGVHAVAPVPFELKRSQELPGSGLVKATALAYPDAALSDVLFQLMARGAVVDAAVTTRIEHVIDFTAPAGMLGALAAIGQVGWIEPAYDEAGLDNELASAITQGGATGAWPVHDHGIDGRSQKVSVCDTGVNTNSVPPAIGLFGLLGSPVAIVEMVHEVHDDETGDGRTIYNEHLVNPAGPPTLAHRKMDLYYSPFENGVRGDSDDSNGHGTHTAGTVAGDAPPYGVRNNHDGVAFAAKLLVCDITIGSAFQVLNDYANYWNPAYDRGARINSNSWGSAHTNTYTEKARQHDAYVAEHRDFLIFRSMGNTGLGNMRPEAVAKSALGIGATNNGAGADTLAGFSTGGLTADGRIKPNVVAPGACLTSSYLSGATSYNCISGTSMSTPTAAGAAALVRDYLERGFHPSGSENAADGFNPSSALVRAMLQISGREISGDRSESDFPNKAQGWGRVTLEDVLYFAGDARRTILVDEGAGLNTGDSAVHTVTVTAGAPLRIMVAWSDEPGAAGANPAIVNDLDLTVTGPGGSYVGNAFVGNEVPPGAAAADRRNVEEAVYVNAPASGTYTITVSGFNVPGGPQPYALVVTGDVA